MLNAIISRALDRAEPLPMKVELAAARAGKRDVLVMANLRLVLKTAAENKHFGIPIEDLVSEGVLGLCEAARRYDPAYKVKFSGYAAFWVRAYIWRHIASNRRCIRTFGRDARKIAIGMRKTQRRLRQELGEEPSAELVADELGVSVDAVVSGDRLFSGKDARIGQDFDAGEVDIADVGAAVDVSAFEQLRTAQLQTAIGKLGKRDAMILYRRFFKEEPDSLTEIGLELGVCRERARQMQVEALQKLVRTGVFDGYGVAE